ncbi:hypothetical protein BJP36_40725 [Moorena producens JHB]|uniref:Uncharacterized protein n=1 Tax=Moorena producens (strain JHB) TaxID=1454205 RepID=A0A9Q9SS81_MOOP1|nr:hypothetical protein [Moorena producens]WAN68693.1 hypothetical protein BJP36_40725 [Moorena producens JHB]
MGETPKTALPSQDRNGAFSVGELNSPRVAPLHRFASIVVHCSQIRCSLFPTTARSLVNSFATRIGVANRQMRSLNLQEYD